MVDDRSRHAGPRRNEPRRSGAERHCDAGARALDLGDDAGRICRYWLPELVVRGKRDFVQTSAVGSDCGEAWALISAGRTASIRRKRTLSQASRRRMLCPAPTRTALMASPRAPARRLRSSRPSDLAWPMIGSTAALRRNSRLTVGDRWPGLCVKWISGAASPW